MHKEHGDYRWIFASLYVSVLFLHCLLCEFIWLIFDLVDHKRVSSGHPIHLIEHSLSLYLQS